MTRILTVILLGALVCSSPAVSRTDPAGDPLAARKAQMDQRAREAFDRIIAARTEPPAATAEDVIAGAVEAMGGRSALQSLRTLKATLTGHQLAGGFGSTQYLKAPNHVRLESQPGSAIVTDGVTAWQESAAGRREMPPGRLVWQQMFSITQDLIDYDAKHVAYEFVGLEALEGGAFYKLRKTISTGKTVYVYFDVQTGLLAMEEEFSDEDGRKAFLLFDYRPVAGVMLPHLKVRIADLLQTPHVAVISYEANIPLEDELFAE